MFWKRSPMVRAARYVRFGHPINLEDWRRCHSTSGGMMGYRCNKKWNHWRLGDKQHEATTSRTTTNGEPSGRSWVTWPNYTQSSADIDTSPRRGVELD